MVLIYSFGLGLFTYHVRRSSQVVLIYQPYRFPYLLVQPAFQILAVLFFAEGILLLQPIGNSKRLKVLGLDIHQASQTLGLLLGVSTLLLLAWRNILNRRQASWGSRSSGIIVCFLFRLHKHQGLMVTLLEKLHGASHFTTWHGKFGLIVGSLHPVG